MKIDNRLLVVVFVALACQLGCSKEKQKSESSSESLAKQAKPEANSKQPVKAEVAPEMPLDTIDAKLLEGVLAEYETCRALLAEDKTEGVAECGSKMAAAAKNVVGQSAGKVKQSLNDISSSAQALAQGAADKMDTLRLAFGEVSKFLLQLLKYAPELAAKYHAFECPMAKGFKRWVQAEEKMANPYMGKAMLECGSEVEI